MAELKQIEINDLLESQKKVALIDVRSPGEFEEFHIPGAENLPLFTNEERAEVGTLYKQKGPETAKARGLEIVSPKLPELYRRVKALSETSDETVIYCWRGGMRSRSLAMFMTMMGTPCLQLKGGIRSYRKLIVAELERYAALRKPFIVIRGYTGSQKTDILQALMKKGYPVLDLEGLAGHRGSIFGSVGLSPKSQKAFDRDLWRRLKELDDAPYYIIEGESKRIGRVVLPDFIMKGKETGVHFFIEYPFEKRVRAIYEAYDPEKNFTQLSEAYVRLRKYLDGRLAAELDEAFSTRDWERVIRLLLENYYDPRYRHKHKEYQQKSTVIAASSVEEAVEKLIPHLDEWGAKFSAIASGQPL